MQYSLVPRQTERLGTRLSAVLCPVYSLEHKNLRELKCKLCKELNIFTAGCHVTLARMMVTETPRELHTPGVCINHGNIMDV